MGAMQCLSTQFRILARLIYLRGAAACVCVRATDDGGIDLEEFLASGGTKGDFAQFDVDGNGTLDPHEVHVYLKMREDSSHVAHVPKLGE